MFTGIVEETGTLIAATQNRLQVGAGLVLEGTGVGDSVAVNGVCLTVTRLGDGCFWADVMPETLRVSTLGTLRPGQRVHLERAMAADGRFGGHLVSGHIDGTGRVKKRAPLGNAIVLDIEAEEELLALVVPKGSIAVDGVSLTVAGVYPGGFRVGIIPHTGASTLLAEKQPGDRVNLETDIVGKYVQRLLFLPQGSAPAAPAPPQGVTLQLLEQNGFLG